MVVCCSQSFCTLYIIRNLLSKFETFKHNHKNLIWALQETKYVEHYDSTLTMIRRECGVRVEEYLRAIPVEKWVLYPNLGVTPLYGWRTASFVESVNGQTLKEGLRRKAPLQFLDGGCR